MASMLLDKLDLSGWDASIVTSLACGLCYAVAANVLRAAAGGKPLGLSRGFNLRHNFILVRIGAGRAPSLLS